MNRDLVSALAIVGGAVSSNSALAAVSVNVAEGGVVVAAWSQSATPVLAPSQYVVGAYADVPVIHSIGLGGDSDVIWYDPAQGGGLSSFDGNLNISGFTTAFAGPTSAPVFHLGTYFGFDTGALGNKNPVAARVTISVPEPATWAMMLVGLGLIGLATRGRRTIRVRYS